MRRRPRSDVSLRSMQRRYPSNELPSRWRASVEGRSLVLPCAVERIRHPPKWRIYELTLGSIWKVRPQNSSLMSYNEAMSRPSTISKLAEFAPDQWGLVTRRQAEGAGVSRATMTRLATDGSVLERVGHGV